METQTASQQPQNYFQYLNGFTLKMIAITTMLIDHIGATIYHMPELRIIGRIAFPIFCFLIVEGYLHTSNLKKYFLRLFLFALISEIPFDLAFRYRLFNFNYQNVFFTLLLGLLALYLMEKWKGKIWTILGLFLPMVAAEVLHTDYGAGGVLIICCFYMLKTKPVFLFIMLALIFQFVYGGSEIFGLLALLPIYLYNGKRGPNVKYIFYLFYPVHLIILALLLML